MEYYHETQTSGHFTLHFHTVREIAGDNIARLHCEKRARVMAVGPELLALVEKLSGIWDDPKSCTGSMDRIAELRDEARAIIAKTKTTEATL